jgi:hypothetical protein
VGRCNSFGKAGMKLHDGLLQVVSNQIKRCNGQFRCDGELIFVRVVVFDDVGDGVHEVGIAFPTFDPVNSASQNDEQVQKDGLVTCGLQID